MKRLPVALVVIAIAFCNWISLPGKSIRKAEWLLGIWENKTPKGSIYESWNKISDDELFGKSYILKEKDTIVFESIRLVQEKDSLFYIPTVGNQNDGLPVRFAVKRISDMEMAFENLQHDFPQLISYTRIGADSLVAEISGIKGGQERKQTFPMRRITISRNSANDKSKAALSKGDRRPFAVAR
ncbi:MAG: hypothetical protein ABS46_21105 [Cytophagaceae bacterium SCN 52-12]|nr:MAG: hypothetical protein ABS46_21105 [Cytophagaceae bacterium SCN 52-12]